MAGARVDIVGSDGKVVDIKAEHLQDALGAGFRQATPEEAQRAADEAQYGGGVANTIKAGLAGAARGATLGLSDVIASDVGAGDTFAKLREHNPAASITGEIAGAVGPAVLSGGESALASGARFAEGAGKLAESSAARALTSLGESGVLGRIAAKGLTKAASGAAEGAVYGAGQAVSDAALTDHDLSAEQILQHVGTGALLGGLVGGGVGAAGETVSAGASKLGKTIRESIGEGDLGGMLTKLKENSALRASNATQSSLAKLEAKGRSQEVANDLLSTSDVLGGKQILDTGGNVTKTLDNIDAVRKSVGKAKGDSLKALSDAGEVIGEGVNPQAVAQKLRREMLDAVSNTPGFETERKAAQGLIDEWEALGVARGGQPVSLHEADAFKQELQNKAKRLYGKEMASFNDDLKIAAARIVNGEIDSAAGRIAKANGMQEVLDGFIESKRMYGSLSEAQKLFQKGSDRISGNRAVSLTDYIFGVGAGALAGGLPGMVTGALGAMANKVLRERGRGMLASTLQRIETTAATGAAVRSGESRLIDAVDRFIGKATSAVAGAAKAASRVAVIATDDGGSYLRTRAAKEDPQDFHRKQVEELQGIVQNPTVTADKIAQATQHLSAANPKVAQALQAKTMQAATFLLSKAPPRVQSQADMLKGTTRPVSRLQLATFGRYVAAATNPDSVIEGLAGGHVSPEAAETMRTLYPKTVDQLRTKMAERIAAGAGISHKQMLVLSQFFATPFSLTLDPSVVAQVQTNWAVNTAAQQQAQSPQPGARVTGMSKASLGDGDLTKSQKLLAG